MDTLELENLKHNAISKSDANENDQTGLLNERTMDTTI